MSFGPRLLSRTLFGTLITTKYTRYEVVENALSMASSNYSAWSINVFDNLCNSTTVPCCELLSGQSQTIL